jgi:hypothetical protein
MDKNRLKEMSRDKRFISGIYNYCDQWCERCTHTSRCLNYNIVEEEFADPETRDIQNDAFWKKLTGIMKDTSDLLKEKASQEGIDLEEMAFNNSEEKGLSIMEVADSHEISRAARSYTRMAEDWFEKAEPLFSETEEADPDFQSFGDTSGGIEENDLDDALQVVKWYQGQIYVKLMRAISGLMYETSEKTEGMDQYARDSDGSAKVALIGIERSIAAWKIIANQLPSYNNQKIKAIMNHLALLRKKIEKDFPEARAFVRPGFDRIDLNS